MGVAYKKYRYKGELLTVQVIAARTGVLADTIEYRVDKLGMTADQAVKKKNFRKEKDDFAVTGLYGKVGEKQRAILDQFRKESEGEMRTLKRMKDKEDFELAKLRKAHGWKDKNVKG